MQTLVIRTYRPNKCTPKIRYLILKRGFHDFFLIIVVRKKNQTAKSDEINHEGCSCQVGANRRTAPLVGYT